MQVKINGTEQTINNSTTVDEMLNELGYQNQFLAVAINRQSVPRSSYAATTVNEQDEIEILAPMSGG